MERRTTPVVRVTLVDRGVRLVASATVGPANALVTLNVYPDVEDVLANMVSVERHGEQGADHFTREAIVVAPDKIMKVELLYEVEGRPHAGFLGFGAPDGTPDED